MILFIKNFLFALKPYTEQRKLLLQEISEIRDYYHGFSINYNKRIPQQFLLAIEHLKKYTLAISKLVDRGLLFEQEFPNDVVMRYFDFVWLIDDIFIRDTEHWMNKKGLPPRVVSKKMYNENIFVKNSNLKKDMKSVHTRLAFIEFLETYKEFVDTFHKVAETYIPHKDFRITSSKTSKIRHEWMRERREWHAKKREKRNQKS